MRILIADDHFAVREGLKAVLRPYADLEVTAEATTLALARSHLGASAFDLVLLDINFPDGSGLDLLHEYPQVRFLVLSMYQERAFLMKAIQLGARGFVGKESVGEVLVLAIRTVGSDHTFLDQSSLDGLATHLRKLPPEVAEVNPALVPLSARERDVFFGILRGQNTKSIALDLGLSSKTVDNYRSSLFAKLGLQGPVDLVRFAREQHLF